MPRLARVCPLALATVLAAMPVDAHPVPFSYVDVRLEAEALAGALVVHVVDVAHELRIEPAERLLDIATVDAHQAAIVDLLSARLRLEADGEPLAVRWSPPEVLADRQSLRLTFRRELDRAPGVVAIDAAMFPYDPAHQTFLNVYEGDRLAQAILDRSRTRVEHFAGSRQGVAAVVRKFLPEGAHHILIGPDHLLFLIGLLLVGGSLRRLALIVTGFTLAHSVTLSLAALDLLSPPASLVEPAIALSIVYVGADNLLVRQGRDVRAWIALVFGFIHGFGFAGVLRDMGLPAHAVGWSLAAFNLGVEIGQLIVVGIVAAALALVRARSEVVGRRLAVGGSVAVIVCGAFWFVERTLLSGGLR